jgi:pectinesterase
MPPRSTASGGGASDTITTSNDASSSSSSSSSMNYILPDWLSDEESSDMRRRLQSNTTAADIVVAQDGSGKYRTITEALANVPTKLSKPSFVIYIKAGVYSEYVTISKKMKNLTLIGDGIGKTIITGSKSFTGGTTTYNSATVGELYNYNYNYTIHR